MKTPRSRKYLEIEEIVLDVLSNHSNIELFGMDLKNYRGAVRFNPLQENKDNAPMGSTELKRIETNKRKVK